MTDVDVVVVGTGPGGEAAAGALAGAGLSVVAVEAGLVGGECPYAGCIPSKTLIRSAELLQDARWADGTAGEVDVEPVYADAVRRVTDVTADWDDSAAAQRLEDQGVRLVRGHGRLVGPRTVQVGDEQLVASRGVLVNTGTRPAVPPIDGLDQTPYWTNRDVFRAEELPHSLAVLGGGAIGIELAQAYARYGVPVTVIEGAPRILAHEEPEASTTLAEVLTEEGVALLTGVRLEGVTHDGDAFTLTLEGADPVVAERFLVAVGRTPNTDDLGLDTVGVTPDHGLVTVDDHQRVTVDGNPVEGLWAIGDITGKGGFTHVSMYQSGIAVTAILGQDGPPASYHALPRVTFTDPELGSVGLTEEQARDQGLSVRTGTTDLSTSSRAATYGPGASGVIKVVEDADRGVLVGATALGPYGGEILGALAVAVQGRVLVSDLAQSIWAYPTFHRAIGSALDDLG